MLEPRTAVPFAGTLALLAFVVAAPVLQAQAVDPNTKCATPTVLRSQPARRALVDPLTVAEGGGQRSGGGVVTIGGEAPAPAAPLAPGSTGAPGTTAGAPPPAAPPTKTQPTPPVPTAPGPPPMVPGLSSPASSKDKSGQKHVAAIQAQGEVPEERLLDVGIEIFGPGVDEDDRAKLAKVGLSPETRRSEGRFIAYHLRKTLEGTGNWGAVRVVPETTAGLDLSVSGVMVESNGKRLVLDVEARDALGRRWLRKRYREEADLAAYSAVEGSRVEAFQDLYNRIANDLLQARDSRDKEQLVTVRRVAALRFAAELAPEAFSSYLKAGKDGAYTLVRYPAEGDPMMSRIARIRERDLMFVDTLNDYYLGFYDRMSGPYADWRKFSYEEQDALDRIVKQSRLKKILGGAAMLAGMMMPRDAYGGNMAGDLAVMGGLIALQAGFQQSGQKQIHEASLKELATSFDADTTPLLVEVEGQQKQLSGSAETQFVAWRELLRRIFSIETGAPDDPNVVVVTGNPTL